MGESSLGTPSVKPALDRLDSWKEIAAYLNRDVTTVQRWEKREGMPVHRHLHDRHGLGLRLQFGTRCVGAKPQIAFGGTKRKSESGAAG